MFVSTNLPAICLIPIKLEIGRQTATECSQTLKEIFRGGLAGDIERAPVCGANFDVIAFLRFSASTTLAGRRTARLLPHLAICMAFSDDIRRPNVYLFGLPSKRSASRRGLCVRCWRFRQPRQLQSKWKPGANPPTAAATLLWARAVRSSERGSPACCVKMDPGRFCDKQSPEGGLQPENHGMPRLKHEVDQTLPGPSGTRSCGSGGPETKGAVAVRPPRGAVR